MQFRLTARSFLMIAFLIGNPALGPMLADEARTRSEITASPDANSIGALLFSANCSVCHMIPTAYRGIYGTDQQSVESTIRSGGNNALGMPAFGELLTDGEISELAKFVRALNDWE